MLQFSRPGFSNPALSGPKLENCISVVLFSMVFTVHLDVPCNNSATATGS